MNEPARITVKHDDIKFRIEVNRGEEELKLLRLALRWIDHSMNALPASIVSDDREMRGVAAFLRKLSRNEEVPPCEYAMQGLIITGERRNVSELKTVPEVLEHMLWNVLRSLFGLSALANMKGHDPIIEGLLDYAVGDTKVRSACLGEALAKAATLASGFWIIAENPHLFDRKFSSKGEILDFLIELNGMDSPKKIEQIEEIRATFKWGI